MLQMLTLILASSDCVRTTALGGSFFSFLSSKQQQALGGKPSIAPPAPVLAACLSTAQRLPTHLRPPLFLLAKRLSSTVDPLEVERYLRPEDGALLPPPPVRWLMVSLIAHDDKQAGSWAGLDC